MALQRQNTSCRGMGCADVTHINLMVVILLLFQCCEKAKLPDVYTGNLSFVTQNSAECDGNVFSDGGSDINIKGICWDTASSPTINDSKVDCGKGEGKFRGIIQGLNLNTRYYVRAYAINSVGTVYGNEKFFRTPQGSAGIITDIQDNSYKTIIIGTQIWMAENLKSTKFNDGTEIPLVTDGNEWANLNTPAYCWYNNDISCKNIYGALYNGYVVNTGKLCPSGWHVPDEAEVNTLIEYFGNRDAARKLRESGTDHWNICPSWCETTNESGFTALGGSGREYVPPGYFGVIGATGHWWTSTKSENDSFGIEYNMDACNDYVTSPGPDHLANGKSIRCIRD